MRTGSNGSASCCAAHCRPRTLPRRAIPACRAVRTDTRYGLMMAAWRLSASRASSASAVTTATFLIRPGESPHTNPTPLRTTRPEYTAEFPYVGSLVPVAVMPSPRSPRRGCVAAVRPRASARTPRVPPSRCQRRPGGPLRRILQRSGPPICVSPCRYRWLSDLVRVLVGPCLSTLLDRSWLRPTPTGRATVQPSTPGKQLGCVTEPADHRRYAQPVRARLALNHRRTKNLARRCLLDARLAQDVTGRAGSRAASMVWQKDRPLLESPPPVCPARWKAQAATSVRQTARER